MSPTPAGWYDDGSGRQRWWNGRQWTDQFQAATARRPESSSHLWWALSPVYSFGAVTFIPALHAAMKLGRRDLWYWAVGLIVGNVLVWGLVTSPSNPDGSSTTIQSVGVAVAVLLAVAGTIQAFRTRNEVFAGSGATTEPLAGDPFELDPAIAKSLAARKRRVESRELSSKDPGLARDLMIGRPDLSRQYDDGGLVDVNHAPEAVLVSHLGFHANQARKVIEVRDQIGRFDSIDDLSVLADVPPRMLDDIRDRIVAL